MANNISIRTRICIFVEGRSEQSFIKLLQQFCNQRGLNIYLDCQPLHGGGYKTMFSRAVHYLKRVNVKHNKSILIVDSDRAERNDDGWTLKKLKEEASKKVIMISIQEPKHEAWLFRLFPGKERQKPDQNSVEKQLRKLWPDYQKPTDVRTLITKFTLDDVYRLAKTEKEFRQLLVFVGLL